MTITAPWNASWSAEMGGYEVRPCRWAEGRRAIWQAHAPGQGKPVFASPHMVRQRKSIAQMLCTVCGEPTREGERWMFDLGRWTQHGNAMVWLTTEAPVHEACADLAMKVCPHIRAGGLTPRRFPARYRTMAAVVGGEEVEKDFGLRLTAVDQVIAHLKIVLETSFVSQFSPPPRVAA